MVSASTNSTSDARNAATRLDQLEGDMRAVYPVGRKSTREEAVSGYTRPMDTTRRTFLREPFSGLSHLLGAVLSVAALVTLLILAHGRLWHAVSFSVYGASLILLYTASGVYHSLWAKPHHLDRLQRFDHIAIFLLIVGTYTPVCLISLHGPLGWTLCGIEFGLAVVGIACSLFWKGFPDWTRVAHLSCHGLAGRHRSDTTAPCPAAGGFSLAGRRRRRLFPRNRHFRDRPTAPVAGPVQRPRPVAHLRARREAPATLSSWPSISPLRLNFACRVDRQSLSFSTFSIASRVRRYRYHSDRRRAPIFS